MSSNPQDSTDILVQLKQEVHTVLSNKQRNKIYLLIKVFLISCTWFASYFIYLYCAASNSTVSCILSVVFIFITSSALSFNLIHEGSHRAFTPSKRLNQWMQILVAGIYGISPTNWFEKHIVRHHVYTNIHKKDFDINAKGLFRYSATESWKPWHQWQAYYAAFLYSLYVIKWIYFTDLRDLILNIYDLNVKTRLKILGEILLTRFVHISLFILIPSCYFSSLSVCLSYYLVFLCLSGLTTATIFQLAHVLPDLSFYTNATIHTSNKLLHQLSATANFASQNVWLTFFTGGLNMQIVHHLFPHISHMDYPTIQPIIRDFCRKNKLPYFEYPSFYAAIKAHFSYLHHLGVKP